METNYYYSSDQYEDISATNLPTSFQNKIIPSSLLNTPTNIIPNYYQHHHHHQIIIPVLDFAQQSSSLSSNNSSTSDEAEVEINHMSSVINERKQRRMISNRESARRSRMRKQKQLDELFSQVLRLRNENYGLLNRLNNFSETHIKVVEENDRLKKETMELKHLLNEAQLDNTFTNLRDLQEDDHHHHGDIN
uniref:basic leucine zipper 43-like n=1 Tax=Erigeron canadensis TaxID=72917 RepID=UPI001CB8F788|nr:basic leucine zipper 43-like [Erigeron canadensis]